MEREGKDESARNCRGWKRKRETRVGIAAGMASIDEVIVNDLLLAK